MGGGIWDASNCIGRSPKHDSSVAQWPAGMVEAFFYDAVHPGITASFYQSHVVTGNALGATGNWRGILGREKTSLGALASSV